MRKTQIAIEFLFNTIMLLLVLITFTYIAVSYYDIFFHKEIDQQFRDYSFFLRQKIIIASNSHQGFHEVFELPEKIKGVNYSIESYGDQGFLKIIANINGKEKEYPIYTPRFNGTIKKGINHLVKNEKGLFIYQ